MNMLFVTARPCFSIQFLDVLKRLEIMPTGFHKITQMNMNYLSYCSSMCFFDTDMCFVIDKAIEYDMHGNLCIPLQYPSPSYAWCNHSTLC